MDGWAARRSRGQAPPSRLEPFTSREASIPLGA